MSISRFLGKCSHCGHDHYADHKKFQEMLKASPSTSPGEATPKCEDCGFALARGELDRSGQEWWCPVCAKAGMRMEENKRLREQLAQAQARVAEAEKIAVEALDGWAQWYVNYPDAIEQNRIATLRAAISAGKDK